MAGNDRSNPAPSILALAVASGSSLAEAARLAGISERTARRRAASPAFRRQVEELRAAIVDEALGKLTANVTKAADTLCALLADANSQVRIQAARSIMDFRSRLRADGELVAKVNELETLVKELLPHVGNHPEDSEDHRPPTAARGAEGQGGEDEALEGRADRLDS